MAGTITTAELESWAAERAANIAAEPDDSARRQVCSWCAKGEHVDHHAGVWRRQDGTDPVVCSCATCEPDLAEPLTSADRVWAIEHAIGHVQGRYVERRILAADDDRDGAQWAADECRTWGMWRTGAKITGSPRGLEVERDGRAGLVRWLELARHVRADHVQATLF